MTCDDFITPIRHVTLWHWPLTKSPWTFVVVRASCVQTLCKIWAKSNNTLQSYWRFSTLSPWNFWGGHVSTKGSQECVDRTSSNLERTYGHHVRSPSLFQGWDILLHFQTRAAQVELCWKRCQIQHFLTPPPVKIRGGVGEISESRFLGFPRTEPRV